MTNTMQQLMDRTRLHTAVIHAWAEARRHSPPNRLPILLFASTDTFRWPLVQLNPPVSVEQTMPPTVIELPWCEITIIHGYNTRYSHPDAYHIIISAPTLDPSYKWIAEQG